MKLTIIAKCLLLVFVISNVFSLSANSDRRAKNNKFEEIKSEIEKLSKDLKKESLIDSMNDIDKINLIWPHLNKSELLETVKLLESLGKDKLSDQISGLINSVKEMAIIYDKVRCSDTEFDSASPLSETFDKYETEPFLQDPSDGSCALYSVLYGLTRVQSLKDKLNGLVKLKDDTYYIKMDGKCYKFSTEDIKKAKSDQPGLFPSKHMGVLAIGKTLNFIDYYEKDIKWELGQYTLFNGGKDLLFSNPELNTNIMNKKPNSSEIDSIFLNDGSYKDLTTGKIYTGDFIASIETNNGSGHNIVAFYNSNEWNLFDNLNQSYEEVKDEKPKVEKPKEESKSTFSKIVNFFSSKLESVKINGSKKSKQYKKVGVLSQISDLKKYNIRSIKLIGTANLKTEKKKLKGKKK